MLVDLESCHEAEPDVDEPVVDVTLAMLPVLEPAGVVSEADVDALISGARSDLARLALELRKARQEAADAERADDSAGLSEARELILVSIEHHLAARRREMEDALEDARLAAAESIATAQAKAAELVSRANRDLLRSVREGTTRGDRSVVNAVAATEPPSVERSDTRFRARIPKPASYVYTDVLLPIAAVLLLLVALLLAIG